MGLAVVISYILHHLECLWAFVRGDKDALFRIDATPRGVALSFIAMVIVEAFSVLYSFLFGTIENNLILREGGLAYLPLQLFLDWAMVPLAFFLLSGPFGFRDRLIPMIVSYNWLSVIVLALILLPSAAVSGGLISGQFVLLILVGVYGTAMWLTYRLLDFILDEGMGMALGLTILTMMLGIVSAVTMTNIASTLPKTDTAPTTVERSFGNPEQGKE